MRADRIGIDDAFPGREGNLILDPGLQSVAEEVHYAIKLLEDGLRASEGKEGEAWSIYLKKRIEAVVDALKPAMLILAPYMPSPIGQSQSDAQEDLSGLREHENHPDGQDYDAAMDDEWIKLRQGEV